MQSFCFCSCTVASSVKRLLEITPMFEMVDYVREMTSKSPVSMAKMDHLTICSSCSVSKSTILRLVFSDRYEYHSIDLCNEWCLSVWYGLLKLMLILFCTSNVQEKEVCSPGFVKYVRHWPVSGLL